VDANKSVETLLDSSEAEPDIEYWCEGETLHIVQFTVEPDSNLFMPLVEHVFEFTTAPPRHTLRTLIRAHPPHGLGVDDIAAQLRSLPRDAPHEMPQLLLFRLRNAGWTNPDHAIAAIDDLRELWWFDGGNAEAAYSIRHELTLVRDAPNNLRGTSS
jgi:hypothetical protein